MKHFELFQYVSTFIKIISGFLFSLYAMFFLSADEKALLMSLISICGLQVIFELGISQVYVSWITRSEGKKSFSVPALKAWFLFSGIFTAILGVIVGSFTFSNVDVQEWAGPLIFTVFGLAINIFGLPNIIVLESEGKLDKSYKMKMHSSIIFVLPVVFCAFFDLGLYVIGLSYLFSGIYLNLNAVSGKASIDSLRRFLSEVKGFLARTSVVWLTGFLFWSAPVLLLMRFSDSVTTASFGITFSLLNAINIFSLSIYIANRSNISRLYYLKSYKKLKSIVKVKAAHVLLTAFLFYVIFNVFTFIFRDTLLFIDESILSGNALYYLSALMFFNLISQIVAVTARSFGAEAFVKEMLVMNISSFLLFSLAAAEVSLESIVVMWLMVAITVCLRMVFKLYHLYFSNLKLC